MGAFPSSLYGDSAFGSSIDYGMGANSTIAPQLISSSGTQARMSPYLQSTIDLYDPNAPWPNSSSLGGGGIGSGGLDQSSSNQNRSSSNGNSNTLYSSPSASSFNLNESSVDPLALTSSALSKSNSLSSNLDFRGSLRAMTDPNCITATEQGRRYLYVLFHFVSIRRPNLVIRRKLTERSLFLIITSIICTTTTACSYSFHSGSAITLTSTLTASSHPYRTRTRGNVLIHA